MFGEGALLREHKTIYAFGEERGER
jgi:hypothetical protein